MFLIQETSYHSENPIFQKLPKGNGVMFIIPEARVAKDYFNTGYYEKGCVDWCIQNFIKHDKNIIDIGAHIGWYSINMAKYANHVYSFECSPKSFNYLCANIALNEQDYKITKYNCALGNENGNTPYFIRDPNDGGSNGISKFECDNINNTPFINVPVKTLDSYEISNVNFIKIDVEGHEKQVLQGAIKTIEENNYPKILFECWDENREKDNYPAIQLKKELFEFFQSLEYKIVHLGMENYLAERN
jgi:FkbM family methyltransferase